ncbi:hypothetical protein B0A50_02538 [Salinomyces thailandicus]|uniref:Uncharacterized protein n=1 Tax=Salinomyces thailandicus TaxID=706561 RepID=A0A4U0U595_9PEZI|nr:hypothetical protein B0A50_02538 [Salinomyces thailandica]
MSTAPTQTYPPAFERNNETGLSNSTHSSTSSAERYRLDESNNRPILIYKYRGRLQTSSQKDLCAWLDKDENLRCTKKAIPRGSSYLDVKRHDLYLPDEKDAYSSYPNFDSSLAAIKVPSLAYWSRMFLGTYDELYIVSPESSPASSLADSESRKSSPTSSWGSEGGEDAFLGAGADEGK